MPKVTVLMPTYNVAPWVEAAVRSVLAQTYQDFVLLVMDDCSADNTIEVVRSMQDSRIRVEKNEHNLGLSANLNRGLSLIETEYVARMDGDDIAEPTWLEKEVAVLDAHPEIGICSAGWEWFGSKAGVGRYPELPEDNKANLLFSCTVIVPTFRMSLYRELGLKYREDAFPAEDYRFWADCVRHTQIYNIQETLFRYRMHETQICSAKREAQIAKVSEVRRYMLQWLNPDIPEDKVQYFLKGFIVGSDAPKADIKNMKAFAEYLMEQNSAIGHFSQESLRKRLQQHQLMEVYGAVRSQFFSDGYSIRKYMKYLCSGLAFKTNRKYETKFLLKSLFGRK